MRAAISDLYQHRIADCRLVGPGGDGAWELTVDLQAHAGVLGESTREFAARVSALLERACVITLRKEGAGSHIDDDTWFAGPDDDLMRALRQQAAARKALDVLSGAFPAAQCERFAQVLRAGGGQQGLLEAECRARYRGWDDPRLFDDEAKQRLRASLAQEVAERQADPQRLLPSVALHIAGGILRNVIADRACHVTLVDFDVDERTDADNPGLVNIAGEGLALVGPFPVEVSPEDALHYQRLARRETSSSSNGDEARSRMRP